jgi:hypothetical protein
MILSKQDGVRRWGISSILISGGRARPLYRSIILLDIERFP